MAELEQFKEWLSSAHSGEAIVETIQISHPAMGDAYLARWQTNFFAPDEKGIEREFLLSDFAFEIPTVQDNTEQVGQVTMRALDGRIYEAIRMLTPEQRQEPPTITHRFYMSNNPKLGSLQIPPPKWYISSIQVTRETVTAELISTHLRERAIGLYYTISNFGVLRYA